VKEEDERGEEELEGSRRRRGDRRGGGKVVERVEVGRGEHDRLNRLNHSSRGRARVVRRESKVG